MGDNTKLTLSSQPSESALRRPIRYHGRNRSRLCHHEAADSCFCEERHKMEQRPNVFAAEFGAHCFLEGASPPPSLFFKILLQRLSEANSGKKLKAKALKGYRTRQRNAFSNNSYSKRLPRAAVSHSLQGWQELFSHGAKSFPFRSCAARRVRCLSRSTPTRESTFLPP